MASEEHSSCKTAFSRWKYYFKLTEVKGKNVQVECKLCPRTKYLSTSCVSNSNLMKHLSTAHASTKLVVQEYTGCRRASVDNGAANKEGPFPCKQQKLDFSASAPQKLSQTELYGLIGRYVVENMLPISTVESEHWSQLEDLATTADIWTAHNKSYLGVTAHWMHPVNMQRKKAALACRRFKGRHTHESIATELDNIHSSYGISHKITATITDNGSNFLKAFKKYQPVDEDDDSVDEEGDEVTFVDINDVLQARVDEDEDVINLPPHYRCASHTLNLVSCSDIEKWILSRPEKALYRSATAKCTALWNKASRSTVPAETVEDVVAKKLIVPCSTRWNSFYDALARICEIPLVDLITISSKFGLKAITEKEHQLLKEYCIAMKPLTVTLDILQGEDNCYLGTLLPTLETLMMKTIKLKSGLQILVDLPEDFNINYRTLARYCKTFTPAEIQGHTAIPTTLAGYKSPRQVFSTEMELHLENYIKRSSDIYFGLSPLEVRKQAVAKGLKFPQIWSDKEKASTDF
uniref:BED-type domain-containing protein n=1 Tax=Cyprinodon variegatus TaxID=28743 RepID=A0A3Q2CSW0_CYPVA